MNITTHELLKLAKVQDPEPELYKMSYGEFLLIKEMIEDLVRTEKDDRLFSSMMKLKSHIMICQDWVRYNEVRKIEKLASLEEIVSYIEKSERLVRVPIYV